MLICELARAESSSETRTAMNRPAQQESGQQTAPAPPSEQAPPPPQPQVAGGRRKSQQSAAAKSRAAASRTSAGKPKPQPPQQQQQLNSSQKTSGEPQDITNPNPDPQQAAQTQPADAAKPQAPQSTNAKTLRPTGGSVVSPAAGATPSPPARKQRQRASQAEKRAKLEQQQQQQAEPAPECTPLGSGARQASGEANICAACLRPIKERYLLVALDKQWHEDCLKCQCCDCRLGEVGRSLFIHSDKIFCQRDFLRIFGRQGNCAACSEPIPPYELVMRANDHAYHLDCFTCQHCRYRFCVDDRFYLTEAHGIVCVVCHADGAQASPRPSNGEAGGQPAEGGAEPQVGAAGGGAAPEQPAPQPQGAPSQQVEPLAM